MSGSRGTYKFGGNLSYWDTYNDTVFTILPDLKYKAALILCPGDHIVPRAHIPDPAIIKKYMMINQLFETRRFWIIIYLYKIPVLAMIDKNTREAFVYHLKIEQPVFGSRRIGGIDNDLDGGLRFLPQNYFEENGNEYMVGIIYPDQIKAYISTSEFKNSIPKYPEKKKELANSMKETDNPVLMLVRLKK